MCDDLRWLKVYVVQFLLIIPTTDHGIVGHTMKMTSTQTGSYSLTASSGHLISLYSYYMSGWKSLNAPKSTMKNLAVLTHHCGMCQSTVERWSVSPLADSNYYSKYFKEPLGFINTWIKRKLASRMPVFLNNDIVKLPLQKNFAFQKSKSDLMELSVSLTFWTSRTTSINLDLITALNHYHLRFSHSYKFTIDPFDTFL